MTLKQTLRLDRRGLLAAGAACLMSAGLLAGPARADSVSDIKARGQVVIGIQGDNPPWGYVDPNGVQQGFDADIGKAFADYLGVKVKFVPLAVVNRIPALVAGRVDILFATMAMLPDRAKAVQFSEPYVANIIELVGPKSATIKTPADMKNFVIGVPTGSTQDIDITKEAPAGTVIRRFNDDAATIQALISGQVQAVGGNMFYLQTIDKAKPGVYENKLEFTRLYNGACTKLGDKALNATANAFIEKIKANGVLAKAYQKWMGMKPPVFPKSVPGIPFTVS